MTDTSLAISGYHYDHAGLNGSHNYLLPTVFRLLDGLNLPAGERRLFELGCGNGSVAHELARRGWDVTGVDPRWRASRKRSAPIPTSSSTPVRPMTIWRRATANSRSSSVWKWSSTSIFPASMLQPYFHCYRGGGVRPSCPRPTTATGKTSLSRSAAKWTDISPPCGITATSSSGPCAPSRSCSKQPASTISASSESVVSRRWPRL